MAEDLVEPVDAVAEQVLETDDDRRLQALVRGLLDHVDDPDRARRRRRDRRVT